MALADVYGSAGWVWRGVDGDEGTFPRVEWKHPPREGCRHLSLADGDPLLLRGKGHYPRASDLFNQGSY